MEILVILIAFIAGGVLVFLGLRNSFKNHFEQSQKSEIELRALWDKNLRLEKELSKYEVEMKALHEKFQDQKLERIEVEKKFLHQFENLSTKLLDSASKKLTENSEKGLSSLLNPLKEKIGEFQKKVEETYQSESRERFALKSEIEKIVDTNQKMTIETTNLTRALRGDVKAQGNWGEIILERILEASGLREGEEYTVQGTSLGLRAEDGRIQKPDVIINLPESKHLIVDSKVSLTHYERGISESKEPEKEAYFKEFISSLYVHIAGLSEKRYQDLEGLGAPDFVMLFVPTEGAFSLAAQKDPEIFNHAWNKGIVVVSPTTLLATLRTIASLWKQERQTKNALEIARQGGLLYDKFVGFSESLSEVGKAIQGSQIVFDEAMNRLSVGKGNLVARVENLKKLGARASKKMPPNMNQIDSSELESELGI